MRHPKIAAAAIIIAGGITAALVATSSAAPALAAETHFNATYYEGNSIWTCPGTHTTTKSGAAKESETCLVTGDTTGYANDVGTYTGRPGIHLPGGAVGVTSATLALGGIAHASNKEGDSRGLCGRRPAADGGSRNGARESPRQTGPLVPAAQEYGPDFEGLLEVAVALPGRSPGQSAKRRMLAAPKMRQ